MADEGLKSDWWGHEVAGFRRGTYLVSKFAWEVIDWAKANGLDLSVKSMKVAPRTLVHQDYRFLGPVRYYAKQIRKAGGWPRSMARVVAGIQIHPGFGEGKDRVEPWSEMVIFDGGHRAQAAIVTKLPLIPIFLISYETWEKAYREFHVERGTWLYILGAVNERIRKNLRKADRSRKQHWPFD